MSEPSTPGPPPAPPTAASGPAAANPVTGAPRAGPRAWLPSLQSLRGLAALWVVVYHLDVTMFTHGLPLLPIPGMRVGWLGVDLFFVLSAYLLGQPFVDGRARPYLKFLWDRFLRLAPAYYAAALLAAAVVLWISVRNFHPDRVALSLVFLTNWDLESYFALNPAFWSLAVEMQFYLVLPFLAPLFRGRRWPWALAACLLVAVLFRALTYRWGDLGLPGPDARDAQFAGTFWMPAFLGHFALGLAACRIRSVPRPGWVALAGLPLIAIPVALWIPDGSVAFGFESLKGQVLVRPLAAAGFTLVLLGAATAGGLQRALSIAPLRWLGDISYSLYLAHIPIQLALDIVVDGAANPWTWRAASFACSLAIGAGLYYAVERPAERRRHQRKLRERVEAQAAAPAG